MKETDNNDKKLHLKRKILVKGGIKHSANNHQNRKINKKARKK
jgi:hypothetical protein